MSETRRLILFGIGAAIIGSGIVLVSSPIAQLLFAAFSIALFYLFAPTKFVLKIPQLIAGVFSILVFRLFVMLPMSSDITTSIEQTVILLAYGALFVYFYSTQANDPNSRIGAIIIPYASTLAALWIGSLIVSFLFPDINIFSEPLSLAVMRFGHNNLGHIAVIGFIYIFYSPSWKIQWIRTMLCIIFFIAVIFSYSRTAYLSISLVILIHNVVLRKKRMNYPTSHRFITWGMIGVCALFYIITTNESKDITFISPLNQFLEQYTHLPLKDFFASRLEYAKDAFVAFQIKPFTGYGLGNYFLASLRSTSSLDYLTSSSNNLFLDTLVEIGLVGWITFILLCGLIARGIYRRYRSKNPDNRLVLIFLAIGITCLFDSIYKIPSFTIVCMAIIGNLYHEDKDLTIPARYVTSIGILTATYATIVLSAQLFLAAGKPLIASTIYPIHTKANLASLAEVIQNNDTASATRYIQRISVLNKENPSVIQTLAFYEIELNNYKSAEKYYDQYLKLVAYPLPTDINIIFNTLVMMNKKDKGHTMLHAYMNKLKQRPVYWGVFPMSEIEELRMICLEIALDCRY